METAKTNVASITGFRIEQRRRWDLGERRIVEALLEENPQLALDREGVLSLIYDEVALREDRNERLTSEEYAARFPCFKSELLRLFQMHRCLASIGEPEGPATKSSAAGSGPIDWTGRMISHYRVNKRLAAGGMGEVYLADDLALGRATALKLLRTDFSPVLRARLLREATTNARLQHPCIATFYEAGEPDGAAFIAMEYVPGETLREHLIRGPLTVDQTLAIATCLLEALAHAHALGILHRDVKPENIMITGAHSAKLLDFGIARQISASDSGIEHLVEHQQNRLGHTQAGFVLGTPGYMAPEQIEGGNVDARADLFSVGVCLYEAVTGHTAIRSSTAFGRMAATLVGELPSLNDARVPDLLKPMLARALARNRAERYASATEFLGEIRRIRGRESASVIQESLLIADLENFSPDGDAIWIGTGFAETARKNLARISGLRIATRERIERTRIARSESGASTDFADLGLALGCRWAVIGSYSKTGSALQLAVSLVDVPTREVAWSDQFAGPVEGMFAMQDRLFEAVATNLKLQRPARSSRAPASARVYECHVRGQQLWWSMDKRRMQEAQQLFEEAVALDPGYAPALAGLAGMHALRFTFTVDPKLLELSERYAERALEADPYLSEAYIWLGYVRSQQEALIESYLACRKAFELDPGNHLGWYFAGANLAMTACPRRDAERLQEHILGRVTGHDSHEWLRQEGLKLLQRSVELDPSVNPHWVALGMTHLELGNFVEAEWCLRRALDLELQGLAAWSGTAGWVGECLRRRGDLQHARQMLLSGLDAIEKSNDAYRDTFRGIFFCALGRTALQQAEPASAAAAFNQAILHHRGRPRARAGGHALVQALAGMTRAGAGSDPFEEALELFWRKESFNFAPVWCCTAATSLVELGRAANSLQRAQQAAQLFEQAVDHGSREAAVELQQLSEVDRRVDR